MDGASVVFDAGNRSVAPRGFVEDDPLDTSSLPTAAGPSRLVRTAAWSYPRACLAAAPGRRPGRAWRDPPEGGRRSPISATDLLSTSTPSSDSARDPQRGPRGRDGDPSSSDPRWVRSHRSIPRRRQAEARRTPGGVTSWRVTPAVGPRPPFFCEAPLSRRALTRVCSTPARAGARVHGRSLSRPFIVRIRAAELSSSRGRANAISRAPRSERLPPTSPFLPTRAARRAPGPPPVHAP